MTRGPVWPPKLRCGFDARRRGQHGCSRTAPPKPEANIILRPAAMRSRSEGRTPTGVNETPGDLSGNAGRLDSVRSAALDGNRHALGGGAVAGAIPGDRR